MVRAISKFVIILVYANPSGTVHKMLRNYRIPAQECLARSVNNILASRESAVENSQMFVGKYSQNFRTSAELQNGKF